jgi:pyrimidine-nucleoside phosphorylase
MRAVDLIGRKRDGLAHNAEEIDFLIQGFYQGSIPDYQMAAWLMAVFLRGMERQETIDLTMAMVRSGQQLNLRDIAAFVTDKHSTGGVGDKTTLVVVPLVAASGLYVGKITGRGLGFTGGTLDKLESIPGFRTNLSRNEFLSQLRSIGIVVTGQSDDLAPVDGLLYALRDSTATVDSLPLIASSIMSKKIASGANGIVLDVKVGKGAFMRTEADALALATLMVHIGRGLGRKVRALISDMNQPLGRAVGNALELREALDTLHGQGPADFRRHCLAVASEMVLLSGPDHEADEPATDLAGLLDNGQAFAKFREWISVQGGDPSYIDDPTKLPTAQFVQDLPAPRAGYVAEIDASIIGLTSMLLGGGRAKKGDSIDYAVGIVLQAKVGDWVEQGQPLLTIHANDSAKLSGVRQHLLAAYGWSDEPVSALPLIHRIVS